MSHRPRTAHARLRRAKYRPLFLEALELRVVLSTFNVGTESALRAAITAAGVTLHEPFGHLEIESTTIAFVHGDDHSLLRSLENSGAYDFVFHGHTHVRAEHRMGPTRVINPGALHRARPKTFAVLDLAAKAVTTVEVPEV